ncbi:hypothetical protein B0H16DRAFT_1715646 [Mycena metata]|uniref:DUF6533 domain-containing protein n=1 Tax=Mycena metata TaxID=1033252 RepID=A0AAD7NPS5_9AGAR|nr:hypothetical protein B0H16DRAFT_1715646 [Mycena metata]
MATIPPPPPPTPAELEQLLQLAKDAKITSYFAVAALTFLIYDHVLAFDKEMTFIWTRRKSVASYIYIWNRYFTLIITCINTSVFLREMKTDKSDDDHDPHSLTPSCQIYTQFLGCSATFIVASVDAILLLRVWILFGKSRRLVYFLVPLMTAELGAMFFIAAYTIQHADQYVHAAPERVLFARGSKILHSLSSPVPGGSPSLFYPKNAEFKLTLYKTFTMFVMTVHNCRVRLGATFRTRNNTMPLVHLFLRDGIYWFLAVVAVNPPQIIIWAVARPTLTDLLIIPSIVVYSIIGSRVLLNIMEIMTFGVPSHQIDIASG